MISRYVASELEGRADVLLWKAKYAIRRGRAKDASYCTKDGKHSAFGLKGWFELAGKKADLVVVLGSGTNDRDLPLMFEQPWVGPHTIMFHVPISHNTTILNNEVANFDLVIPDSSFVKPLHLEHITEFQASCRSQVRGNTLVWVARYLDWKVRAAPGPHPMSSHASDHRVWAAMHESPPSSLCPA